MSKFGITSLLTLASVLSLSMLGAMGAPEGTREPAAAPEVRFCGDITLNHAAERLASRNRLAKGLAKNQAEYIAEVEKNYQSAHKAKRSSEAFMYVSTALISVMTMFPEGKALAGEIWGGQSLLMLARAVNDRIATPDSRQLEFSAAADPLGAAQIFSSGDVLRRVEDRFAYFDEQQRKLSDAYAQVMTKFSNGFWGRVSDSLSLGLNGEEYTAAVLAEAKYRAALYETEAEYTDRALLGIRNTCFVASGNEHLKHLNERDLVYLAPLL